MRRLFTLCLATTSLLVATPRAPESRPTEVSDAGATQTIALAKAAKKPSVSEILVTPKPAGDVTIDVAMTQPAKFQVYRFDHPDRLVVDVEGTTNAVPQETHSCDLGNCEGSESEPVPSGGSRSGPHCRRSVGEPVI